MKVDIHRSAYMEGKLRSGSDEPGTKTERYKELIKKNTHILIPGYGNLMGCHQYLIHTYSME